MSRTRPTTGVLPKSVDTVLLNRGSAMAIVRTVEWKLRCSAEEADGRLRQALTQMGLQPQGAAGSIHGAAKRALMKNRWSAEVDVEINPTPDGTSAVCRVSMPAGTKHYEVAATIVEAVGDQFFDDRGLVSAGERLGKPGRLFGRKEFRHLGNLLRFSEHVQELGQGQFAGKQGLVVLTDERIFFLEKSLGSETMEQFDLDAITSVGLAKKITGETLRIFTAGHTTEIKSMGHGQGDAIERAFRTVQHSRQQTATAQARPASAPNEDPITQIERLASLRDRGLLSSEEFEAKKAELIGRM